jgi:hypothetical protein
MMIVYDEPVVLLVCLIVWFWFVDLFFFRYSLMTEMKLKLMILLTVTSAIHVRGPFAEDVVLAWLFDNAAEVAKVRQRGLLFLFLGKICFFFSCCDPVRFLIYI